MIDRRFNSAPAAIVGLAAAALVVSSSARAQSDAAAAGDRFVGVYAPAAYAAQGDEPTRRISYAANGQISAMLFPPGREPLADGASAEEHRDSMCGTVLWRRIAAE